ncbi:MAG TPA: VWA domain-containing protein [Vicinamibacterales bacterium]|nr:VWA domain-containing protein [Vicinamibacterales bacterium]
MAARIGAFPLVPLLLALLEPALPRPAPPLAAQTPQPRFRSGIDLVTVDVAVLDEDGRPIDDLRVEDFDIRVDGAPRRVVSAQFVALGRTGDAVRSARATGGDFSSNDEAREGRLVLLAVDQPNIRRADGGAAIRAAVRFLDSLDPADRVAVTGLARLGPFEFTLNRAASRLQLERLMGEGDARPFFSDVSIGLSEALAIADGNKVALNEVVLRECGELLSRLQDPARIESRGGMRDPCPVQVEQVGRALAQHARTRTQLSLDALLDIVRRLGEIEGPKVLVLLSEGLVAEPHLVDLTELGAAAQAARVTLYVLQLDVPVFEAAEERPGPTFDHDRRLRADGLQRLAGAARGAVFLLAGRDDRPFRRIARELSGHYLLAFEPEPSDRDGRAHRIEVVVRRPSVIVRGRPAFRVERVMARVAPEERLVALLRSPRMSGELPLRVATFLYREPSADRLRLVVSVESDRPAAAETPSGEGVLVGFVLVDDRSVIAASGLHEAPGGRHAFSALIPPGEYALKVAALDPLGRTGSVERPFSARMRQAGALEVSDLLLAPVPASREAPLEPFVHRAARGPALAYLELYASDAAALADLSVRVEIAAHESAPALVAVPATVHRSERLAVARAVLPLDTLPAGRYLARAAVSAGAQAAGHVVRLFELP